MHDQLSARTYCTTNLVYGAPTNSVTPDLVYNAQTNEFLVVWVESAGEASDEVYAQRVRSDGTLLGDRLMLGAQTGSPYRPAVGYHAASNTYVAVWSDQRAGNWDAYARPIEADGTLLENPVALEATAANQTEVTISRQGAGFDLLVLYTDDRSGSPDLYAERYIPPAALFTAAPLSGTRPLTVTFTDQSTIPNPLTWRWDFGDGLTSTLPSPVHMYAQGGRYTVKLSVSNGLYTKTFTLPDLVRALAPHRTVITYTYDGLYRLTKADSTGATTTTFAYAYDAAGNRTAQTRTITSTQVVAYQYDAANRLTSVNGQAHTWDDNGNLVSDGEKTYTYNQANRLTDLTQGATTFQFNYNGDGARLRQVIAGVPTTYTQDLAAPLPVVLQSKTGANAMQYVYALGTRPLAQYGTTPEYLLADALGSVRQIVDGSGNVTLAESYEPYGSVLNSNGTASSIFAYAGEQIDTSGLIYLRARYMQPMLGIFLARDPWSGDQLRPGSMNGWNYGDDNPVNRVDPTGRFSAVTLAETFGYSKDLNGVLALFDELRISTWWGPGSNWGWAKLLLDAQEGDSVYSQSFGFPPKFEQVGVFHCLGNSKIYVTTLKRPIVPPINPKLWDYLPDGMGVSTRWRGHGAYALVSQNGISKYRDSSETGGSDMPDMVVGGEGIMWGSGGGIIDMNGNIYGSASGGPGLAFSAYIGDGYLFRQDQDGSLIPPYRRYYYSEDELKREIEGFSGSLCFQLLFGGCVIFPYGPYKIAVYTINTLVNIGGSVGASVNIGKDPNVAWADKFAYPAPTKQEVEAQIVQSLNQNPCNECSAGH